MHLGVGGFDSVHCLALPSNFIDVAGNCLLVHSSSIFDGFVLLGFILGVFVNEKVLIIQVDTSRFEHFSLHRP